MLRRRHHPQEEAAGEAKGRQKESHYDRQLDKLLKIYVPDDNERYGLKNQIEKIIRQEFIDISLN
mgnify:CR=1 FL=1